jgi:hypothetical protein
VETKKRKNDSVTFTVVDKDVISTQSVNCYQSHMSQLWGKKFILSPDRNSWYNLYNKNSEVEDGLTTAAPFNIFAKWVNLCQLAGCCYNKVEIHFDDDGGNHMTIPPCLEKHIVYGSLCTYRWAESLAPMVVEAVEIWDNNKNDIHPMQVLHYVFGKHVVSTGHSWNHISISTDGQLSSLSLNYGNKYNLGLSLTASLFWSWTQEQRIEKYTKDTAYTQNRIADLTTSLVPQEYKKGIYVPGLIIPYCVEEWDNIKKGGDRIILHPIWKEFFEYFKTGNDLTTKTIKEKYQHIIDSVPHIKNGIEKLLNSIKKSVDY